MRLKVAMQSVLLYLLGTIESSGVKVTSSRKPCTLLLCPLFTKAETLSPTFSAYVIHR
jgi:hypothetical protein